MRMRKTIKKNAAPPVVEKKKFYLNQVLRADVQALEDGKKELIVKFRLMQAELAQVQAEIQGIEGAVYSIFRADALTNGRIKSSGQKIEFLGDFKYKVIDVPESTPEPDDETK